MGMEVSYLLLVDDTLILWYASKENLEYKLGFYVV